MATLKAIIDYSKANPNTDYAKQAYNLIKSGKFDQQAQQEGIDLSWAGRPALKQQSAQPIQPEKPSASKEIIGNTIETYKNAPSDFMKSIQPGAELIQKGIDTGNQKTDSYLGGVGNRIKGQGMIMGGAVESALGAAVSGINTVFAPITGLAKTLTDHISNAIISNPTVMKDPTVNKFLDFINNSQNELSSLAKAHPEAVRNIGNALQLALIAAGAKTGVAEKPVGTVEGIVSGTKEALESAKGGAMDIVQGVKELPGKISEKVNPTPTLPEVTGRITGAIGGEVSVAQRGLQGVDLNTPLKKGAEYSDLSKRFDTSIKSNLKSVDEVLSKDNTSYSSNELTQRTPTGKFGINYVKQAIQDLKDFYSGTKDVDSLEKVKILEKKLNTDGLTAKEVNDLSKEYGSKFNAFKANNQIKGGKIAAGAENVRSGLKDTARGLIKDPEVAKLDKQTSDMIKTKEMVDDLNTKVDKFKNNYRPGTPLQKFSATIVRLADRVSGGILKGAIKEVTGKAGAGEGTKLDILQLQNELQKNIDLFNKVQSMKPEDAINKLLDAGESSFNKGVVPETTESQLTDFYNQAVGKEQVFYHGTSKASAENIRKAGGFTPETTKGIKDLTGFDVPQDRPISLTLDKKTAELYSGIRPEGGTGELLTFKGNLKLATEEQVSAIRKSGKDIVETLRKQGYDGYHTSSPHDEMIETIVFNKEKLKLVNQAVKGEKK